MVIPNKGILPLRYRETAFLGERKRTQVQCFLEMTENWKKLGRKEKWEKGLGSPVLQIRGTAEGLEFVWG